MKIGVDEKEPGIKAEALFDWERGKLGRMKKQNNKKILFVSGILAACLVLTGILGMAGYRLLRHERSQSQRISEVSAKVRVLSERVTALEEVNTGQAEAEAFRRECEENSLGGGTTTWRLATASQNIR